MEEDNRIRGWNLHDQDKYFVHRSMRLVEDEVNMKESDISSSSNNEIVALNVKPQS